MSVTDDKEKQLSNYNKRFKEVKDTLSSATIKKKLYEDELNKLKSEYKELQEECDNEFECEPHKLHHKIAEIENLLSEKLNEAIKLMRQLEEE